MDSDQMSYVNLLNSESVFTDLNELPSNHDFQANQNHSNGYTCEEPTNEDCTYEEMYSALGNKKVAQRQDNFTTEEDKLLVSAWLNVSLDAVKGCDQKNSQFWKRITKYFEENKTWSGERSEKSLTNRWSKISKDVSKFSGHYVQIDHLRKSGYTEQDKVTEAKEKFKKEEKHAFVLDHCWVIMRFQQKWMDEHKKLETKRKFKPTSSETPDSINLKDDTEQAPEPAGLKKPMGIKASKEVIKKAKSKEQRSGNETSSKSRELLEEFRAKKLESECRRIEQFELLFAIEQKQVALREKEIELQTRSEDAKIMAMDTSVMPPMQAEYFISLQKEILAKRASSNDM